jgi:hypothetical protein
MKILIREEQLKLIEQIEKRLKIPPGYEKVSNTQGVYNLGKDIAMNCYLYFNPKDKSFYHIGLAPDYSTRIIKLSKDMYDIGKFNDNNTKKKLEKIMYDIGNIYDDKTKGNAQEFIQQYEEYSIEGLDKKPNASKTSNPVKPKPVSTVKPNQVGAVKTDPKEQRWVGIWEKFLVKYVGFTGGDKDNLTSDIDKAVYKFISQNNKLYTKNKNIKLGNLEKLMTDGKKGPVHDSFLPPYYYNTEKLPIYFYQKSNIIKVIQKKLGVKQTGIFLNQTESAIVKRIKVKNGQGYNIKYDRRNGITQEIYDAIMSGDVKIVNGETPELIPTKQNTYLEPVSDKIKTDLSNKIK